jgi:hypothetical protein
MTSPNSICAPPYCAVAMGVAAVDAVWAYAAYGIFDFN